MPTLQAMPSKPKPPSRAMTGAELRELIERAGLTSTEASERLKVSRPTVWRWINSKTRISPAMSDLIRHRIKPKN